ncbi:TetR/AcrR family transcriptional regulator [Streptomyces monticola]|uniref:TetR/AcrR family transcriptional regulator n=1 Tax=Streptomyces monticola TaxID=2666263 RepID=A0ABW2JE51_9ACTN
MTSSRPPLHPRKQPKQVRAELTRQRILTAAAHVFADHGYAAGTTNRIAERAGVSIGSLYQYYPNKDAILVELVTAHLSAGISVTERHRAGELPSAVGDIMRLFVRAAIDNHRDHPELLRVLLEQAPRTPRLLEMIREYEEVSVAFVQELIEQHPGIHVGDPRTAARIVVSSIEFLVHGLIAAPDPVDLPSFEDELVTMLTRYLTAGPL